MNPDMISNAALPITNAVIHSVAQLGVGIGSGILLEYAAQIVFTRGLGQIVVIHTPVDAILESLEIAAQVVAGSFVVGSVMNYIAQLPFDYGDPTSGAIFTMAYFASQPQLMAKMARLTEYLKNIALRAEEGLETRLLHPESMDGSRGRGVFSAAGQSRVQQRALHNNTGVIPSWQSQKATEAGVQQ